MSKHQMETVLGDKEDAHEQGDAKIEPGMAAFIGTDTGVRAGDALLALATFPPNPTTSFGGFPQECVTWEPVTAGRESVI